MNAGPRTEDLLRELAPQTLGALVRRHGDFAAAEDATQEALVAAAEKWPVDGLPENPLGWLVRVGARKLVDAHRRDDARRRREEVVGSWASRDPDPAPGQDDTLVLLTLCCHPALTPGAAIPLALRAVGGLTTREIAAAFLVPEATMAQRISRAKARLAATGARFAPPSADERSDRLASVLHVLYLLFNEGYATSAGPDLARTDLSGEGIRLARALRRAEPDHPEVNGLLALLLLTEARRPARTTADGALIPMAEQDRSRWDRTLVTDGTILATSAIRHGLGGEYRLQAAIAALHAGAPSHAATDWVRIAALYRLLERLTGNPMVVVNRAVAEAHVSGPSAGLAILAGAADRLGDHHRYLAVRAHLRHQAGDREGAADDYRSAAGRARNQRERDHLTIQAARLSPGRNAGPRDRPAGEL